MVILFCDLQRYGVFLFQGRNVHNYWNLHGSPQYPWARISEIVYKDAIEYEARKRQLPYSREAEYLIQYKEVKLPHKFYADFVLFDNIMLEVKAAEGGISGEFVSRTINYLKASKCKIGLIVNFGRRKLEHKRLIF